MLGKSADDAVAANPKGNEKQFDVVVNDENQKPLSLSKDDLVKQLTSPERLLVSNRLIAAYKQNKKEVVDALINAMLPDSDPRNPYRNNLYIVFTLGRIPGGWEGTDSHAKAIEPLRSSGNYRDPTFRKWVDTALENRIRS